MVSITVQKMTEAEAQAQGIDGWSSWECEPSEFPWEYTSTEHAYFFEGKVMVTPKGEDPVEINAGDMVTFPQGMQCTWKVIDTIRKVYRFE